jgi:hypothetical protein
MRSVNPLLAVLVVAAFFTLGLKIGVHVGQQQFSLMESAVRAALVSGELRALRGGKAQQLISSKEIELDGLIVHALTFQEQGHPWLFWPFDEPYEHTRYLQYVAAYRNEHPAVIPELPVSASSPDVHEANAFKEEARLRMEQLQREYGDSTSQ